MLRAFQDIYGRVGSDFAFQSFRELKGESNQIETKLDSQNEWLRFMAEWIAINGVDRIDGITLTTQRRLQVALQDAIQAGEGIQQVARRIVTSGSGIADLNRARVIARTEIISASNAGSLEGAYATGVDFQKEWLATQDDRTRDAHLVADGQRTSKDGDFLVDGEPLEYPGALNGSPANVISCRCTLLYITRDFSDLSEVSDTLDVPDAIEPEQAVEPKPDEEGLREVEPQNAKLTPQEAENFIQNQNFEYIKESDVFNYESELLNTELKTIQNTIAEEQGFNGLPSVIDDDEFRRLANNTDEYIHIYRGVETEDNVNQYYNGDVFASSYNFYGNGTYFASSNQYNIAKIYSKDNDNTVFSGLMKKSDMKIGQWKDLADQWREDDMKYRDKVLEPYIKKYGRVDFFSPSFRKEFPNVLIEIENKQKLYREFGSWATAKGYDAVFVNLPSPQRGYSDTLTEYYIVFNRTKLKLAKSIRGKL
jgi:hypothetical protein